MAWIIFLISFLVLFSIIIWNIKRSPEEEDYFSVRKENNKYKK